MFCTPRIRYSVAAVLKVMVLSGCVGNFGLPAARSAPTIPSSSSSFQESVLYSFQESPDGGFPYSSLVSDSTAALYGTTVLGGLHEAGCGSGGCGTVFKLTPAHSGYVESVLYRFRGPAYHGDGVSPTGALTAGPHGVFYGTTYAGGTPSFAVGAIFKLTPTKSGYAEKIVYRFTGHPSDGSTPYAGLTADAAGTLYGTTAYGGNANQGTVFMLKPSHGGFIDKVLYSFGARGNGSFPYAPVAIDGKGAIYGTTSGGGRSCGCGTVFKLTPSASGYTETVLHYFRGRKDGEGATGGLLIGKKGILYGTAASGGHSGCGTIFELAPNGETYRFFLLYSFRCSSDGGFPGSALLAGPAGSMYGTASGGGNTCRVGTCGTVFKLTPSGRGYVETVLWGFRNLNDGNQPQGSLIADSAGALYGTTTSGGTVRSTAFYGTVFKLVP